MHKSPLMTDPLPAFTNPVSFSVNPATPGPTNYTIPGFPVSISQKKDNWCWAAVTSSISTCRNQPQGGLTQEDVVRPFFPTLADSPSPIDVALTHFGYRLSTYSASDLQVAAAKTSILNHVRDGLPVAIHIRWGGNDNIGHAVCAIGVEMVQGEDALWIFDPSQKDNDDDNQKLRTLSEMDHFDSGLASGKTGKWIIAHKVLSP